MVEVVYRDWLDDRKYSWLRWCIVIGWWDRRYSWLTWCIGICGQTE